jgi:NADPH:quinone reductase-like Zn-dependent oxidoreductase
MMASAATQGLMHALRLHERGGPDSLICEEAPIPFVGIGDVLLRVYAASFTPTELGWPSTWVDRTGRDRRPIIPAHEVSGVVVALGYGTTGVSIEDAVFGLTDWYRDGAGAEYVAVEARNLALKPASVSHAVAAASSLAGLTAWQGLFDHGHLEAGQTVVIHGAAGGVGTLAIQLAHAAGAYVVGTGHARSAQLVTELGADKYIDVDREHFEETVGRVDLVFDLVGGDLLNRSWSIVRQGGLIVSIVEEPAATGNQTDGVHGIFFVVEPNRAELVELSHQISAGTSRPLIGGVFPLEEGCAAFEAKHGRGVPGKIVLQIRDDPRL